MTPPRPLARHLRRAAAATAVIALGLLAGCATDPQTPAEAGGIVRTPRGDPAGHNQIDIDFAQMMVVHSRQSIELAELAREHSDLDAVVALADDFAAYDATIIEDMTALLDGWDVEVPDDIALAAMDHTQMDHTGIGIGFMAGITDNQVTLLGSLSGSDFDGKFLRFMLRHRGAGVAMAQGEKISGQFGAALETARRLEQDQGAQMQEIDDLLRAR